MSSADLAPTGKVFCTGAASLFWSEFRHGARVAGLTDRVLAALRARGLVLDAGEVPCLAAGIAEHGQVIARTLGITYPYALRYFDVDQYTDALVEQSGLAVSDSSASVVTYAVPLDRWEEFVRECTRSVEPYDLLGPADRFPVDWPACMVGCDVIAVDLNDGRQAIDLVLRIPRGSTADHVLQISSGRTA
ncbi:hypothetical protein ABZ897_51110 [Nonomuraea sp. NPDC046802]|uniref:hypothetical protein n=1 Tax=Nonomuraea sp. NPDC046802 TaxID=3154919 RepID=UPI0033CDF829